MLLKMSVSLAGPNYSVSPGQEREFEGEIVDGVVTGEAGRLIAAGFAEPADVGAQTEPPATPVVEAVEPIVEPVIEPTPAPAPKPRKKAS